MLHRIFLFIFSFFLFSLSFAQTAWTYKGEVDQVKYYTRMIPKGIELKYNTTVDVGKNAFVGVLKDIQNYHKWVVGIEKSTLIKEKALPLEVYYRAIVPFPWPFSDRDVVTVAKLRKSADKKTYYVDCRASPESCPKQKDYVRIETLEIDVTMVSISPQKTDFQAVIRIGEAEGIPLWVINRLGAEKIIQVITSLKKLVVQDTYKNFKHISLE